jgi:tetratricopeptide (TPR) repeat protein
LALSFLSVSFLTRAQSYSVRTADSLYASGDYETAATAYERVYFFSKIEAEKIQALINRSYCFKNLGRNFEAYKGLARINSFNLSDSLRCVANYELALNLYLGSYFADAEKFCARNAGIPINSKEYVRTVLLHAFVLNELNNYEQAELRLRDYCTQADLAPSDKDSLLKFVSSYYAKKNIPKLKSLRKARRLSKCLPGAGLFYAGKPGKALLNIGFQLAALGYTGANVYFGNYITAATAGVFMIRSFYTGGVNQLNEVIPKRNYYKTRKFNDTFKSQFISKLKERHAL